LAHAVVGHEDVRPPIIIEVREGNAETFAARIGNAGFDADIFKASVRFLVIENVGDAFEIIWVTIGAKTGTCVATKD